MALFSKNMMGGLLGNMSEVSTDQLKAEYGDYLMDEESISSGFKLVRDVIIFTDKRIITFDKQGATGQKMSVKSIYLSTIVYVDAETAGFGLDDSEMTVTYISSAFLKGHSQSMASKKFEFPKKYNIQPLYRTLQDIAFSNFNRINDM